MQEVNEAISVEAVTSTIFRALVNARNRGDPWEGRARHFLGRAEELLKRTVALGTTTTIELADASASADAMGQQILILVETLREKLCEMSDREQQDPLVAILSPGTVTFFFDWPIGHQFDRVNSIIDLIDPYAPASGDGRAAIVEIRGMLPEYRALCDRMWGLRCKLDMLTKSHESFARLGHVQYSRLRRRMRADGFEPDDIRGVFPDIAGRTATATFA